MRDEKDYAGMPADKLREELVRVTRDLATWSYSLATQKAEEHGDYLAAYDQSAGKSVAERKMDAEMATNMLHRQVLETEGQVAFFTVSRETIIVLIRTVV